MSGLLLFLVGLVFLCNSTTAYGSIILSSGNLTYDAMADMPADFGPRVPGEGIRGLLMVADPEDACEPIRRQPPGTPDWVVLVARSQEKLKNCTFDLKARNAEAAGAIAVIVYDDMYEPLIIMSKPFENPDPGIPAVFVSQRSGVMLKKLLTPGVSTVEITPISDAIWLSMLMSAFAGFLAMSVVMGTFFFIRYQRLGFGGGGQGPGGGYGLGRPAPRTMAPEQIRALPVEIYEEHATVKHHLSRPSQQQQQEEGDEGGSQQGAQPGVAAVEVGDNSDEENAHPGRKGGGTRHTCAICLENYVEGDKLRVLPCQHRYHMECIDQWLSSRKPLCPACRHDATERDLEAGGTLPSAGESAASRIWAFVGGRWLVWRLRNPAAARLARRLVVNVALEGEHERLLTPTPVGGNAPVRPAEQQLQQRQGEGAEAGQAAGVALSSGVGTVAAACDAAVVPTTRAQALSGISASSGGSSGFHAAQESEIVPVSDGVNTEPAGTQPSLAPSPGRRLGGEGQEVVETHIEIPQGSSLEARIADIHRSRESSGSSWRQDQPALSGSLVAESRADSSTEDSDVE